MALKITSECINCSSCEAVCPNNAIYPGGTGWRMSDATILKGTVGLTSGEQIDAEQIQLPLSSDTYYIVAHKCTECVGFHDEPQCASVCPIDCCVPDPINQESPFELERKVVVLHGNV